MPLFAAGVAAFAALNRLSVGITTVLAAETAIIAVATLIARRLMRRSSRWTAIRPGHLAAIAASEAAYQVLAVAEVYVTLLLIRPEPPTIASAVVLETVSRAITMFFKMIPMRIGVDEASSSFVAGHVSLDPASGLTLALVRKLRLAFWSAVGLALLVRRRARDLATAGARPSAVFGSAAVLVLLLVANGASAQTPSASVAGSVAISGPDGAPLVVPGVTVTLRCGSDEPRIDVTSDQGEFRFADVPAEPGRCEIGAELQGFRSATKVVTLTAGQETTAGLQLGLDTLHEEVTVRAAPAPLDGDRAPVRVEQVAAAMMRAAPIAHDRFQDALLLIPGVVRGPDGLLNISGLRSNQSALTFNSANGTDRQLGAGARRRLRAGVRPVGRRGHGGRNAEGRRHMGRHGQRSRAPSAPARRRVQRDRIVDAARDRGRPDRHGQGAAPRVGAV